jgi:tRNA-dihydrouridine synthase B
MLSIGKFNLKSNLILAPMAGISDLPFRQLNRYFGAELAFIEMINCRSLSYKSKRTARMLASVEGDRPLGVQLLGSEEKFLEKGIDIINRFKFDILDFNVACPAKKVVRRGEGAALLRQPDKLRRLLGLIIKNSESPVTVKLRLGWDKESEGGQEAAQICQDMGVCAVFIHGRTKMQGYSGKVDYKSIAKIKKALNIPVIASGDIFSAELAKKMFDETGCDGLNIARGALGNPWIFRQISEFIEHDHILAVPDVEELVDVMLKHLQLCLDFHGEKNGIVIYRKFFAWYTKGLPKVRPLREQSSRVRTKDEMIEIIEHCRLQPAQNRQLRHRRNTQC